MGSFVPDSIEDFELFAAQQAVSDLFGGDAALQSGNPFADLASQYADAGSNPIVTASGTKAMVVSNTVGFDLTESNGIFGFSFSATSESGQLDSLVLLVERDGRLVFVDLGAQPVGNADGTMTPTSYVSPDPIEFIFFNTGTENVLIDDLAITLEYQSPPIKVGCDGASSTVGAIVESNESDDWAAPASYYSGVTGTGTTLAGALRSAMSAGHVQRRYGDFRESAALHDADPNAPGNILLAYNRQSVNGQWNSGTSWNREHVWPQSRQPGSASNSTRGNLGDPHALRPCNPGVNSSRSNLAFGTSTSAGSNRRVGSYYYPGDADTGDTARSLFYSAVRYSLPLDTGIPSGNEMGDLSSLIEWHFRDVPDSFERRRNHVIYSPALNPSYYTSNRNAFVDLPGAAWSVFVDNLNDSQLWVGDTPEPDGSSLVELCQQVIVGTDPQGVEVALNRGGNDGVYYAVESDGNTITNQPLTNGFTGAFASDDNTPRTLTVGLDPTIITGAGLYAGDVTIDNLDMTTGLGSGFGANDADDQVAVATEVFDPSSASFNPVTTDASVNVDLGVVGANSIGSLPVPVYALEDTPSFTAGTVLSLESSIGDTGSFGIVLPETVIEAGAADDIVLSVSTTEIGITTVAYTINASDDPAIAGAASRSTLTISATATITCSAADRVEPYNVIDLADLQAYFAVFDNDESAAELAPPSEQLDAFDVAALFVSVSDGCSHVLER